jgi:hypothetical protein
MPILIDEDLAMTRLKAMVQDEVCPTLNPDELQLLLDGAKRAAIWTASTAFSIGDVVIPTTNNRNGHRYVCIAFDGSGVSSATTEPTWSSCRDATITDGNITWQEDGREFDLWDLRRAAYDGWDMKMSKASPYEDFKQGDQSFSDSQLFEHCKKKRDSFVPVMVA